MLFDLVIVQHKYTLYVQYKLFKRKHKFEREFLKILRPTKNLKKVHEFEIKSPDFEKSSQISEKFIALIKKFIDFETGSSILEKKFIEFQKR